MFVVRNISEELGPYIEVECDRYDEAMDEAEQMKEDLWRMNSRGRWDIENLMAEINSAVKIEYLK